MKNSSVNGSVDNRKIKVMALGLRGVVDVQGGIETHARNLYPLLMRMGCEVEVVQRSPYFPDRRRTNWHGVALSYLWCPTKPGVETAVHSFLGVLLAIVRRPDILHLHAIGPALMTPLARLGGLRVVITHHAEDYRREKWGPFAKGVLRLAEWVGMRFAQGRIVVSSVIGAGILRRQGIETTTVHNGAPRILKTKTTTGLTQFGLKSGRYVLCVARVEPTKRQNDLISAFKMASPTGWKLAIVGALENNRYGREIQAQASTDPRVVLTGFQRGRRLRQLFSHAGLFVLPSSLEGLPIALLEAMSYGIPVAASDIAENTMVPLPSSAFFPVGDTEALAEQITKHALGNSAENWGSMPDVVKHQYSWRNAAAQTLEVYRRVME